MGKIVLGVLAVAAFFVPGASAFTTSIFTSLGASAALASALTLSVGSGLLGVALSAVSSLFIKKPINGNEITEQRLNKSIIPEAPRKMVFGETAVPLDIRYWETYGTDNTNYDEVIAVASHEIESFGDLYLEDILHTFDGSGNSDILGSAFRRFTRTKGVTGTSLSVGTGTKWTNTASMTGMAFMVLKYVYSQENWPRGFPNRITQVCKGAKVYDPRLDSTVTGGSGTHRIDDQSTWQYNDGTTDIGRNPALIALWYLIGYRISGELVCGMGVKTNALNLVEFQQAANDAESQSFYCDVTLSTDDEHETNIGVIEATCGGRLLDPGGLYTFKVAIDDTTVAAVAFDDNDVVGAVQWVPAKKMREQVNIITGVYVDPSSLYQLRSFPEVSNPTYLANDGFKRRSNSRFVGVQDIVQAQKLAWIELEQTRYQGVFKAAFSYKAMIAKNWDIVTLTLASQNWTNKLFRIIQYDLTTKGIILLTLQETSSSIYTTGNTTSPTLGTGTAWDPRNPVAVAGLAVSSVTLSSDGVSTQSGLKITFTAPSTIVKSTLIQYKRASDTDWIDAPSLNGQTAQSIISPLNPNTSYNIRVKHITVANVSSTSWALVTQSTVSDVTDFDNVGGTNKPEDGATVGDPYGASYNLLGSDAGPPVVLPYYYYNLEPIANLGLSVGDVISFSALMTSTNVAADSYRIIVDFFDGADVLISRTNGTLLSGVQTDILSKYDNLTIPANTVKVSVFISATSGAGITARRAMLNRGPVTLPYVAPFEDGATVGAKQGIDFYKSDGSTIWSLSEFENNSITLNTGGYFNNIGTSEIVQNTKISVDGAGQIQGIGSGAGKYIDNADLGIASSGQLTYKGGLINLGAVTYGGLGGRALGLKDYADWGVDVTGNTKPLDRLVATLSITGSGDTNIWVRVLSISGSNGRGSGILRIASTGGQDNPGEIVFEYNFNWGTLATIHYTGSQPDKIVQFRVSGNGSTDMYLDVKLGTFTGPTTYNISCIPEKIVSTTAVTTIPLTKGVSVGTSSMIDAVSIYAVIKGHHQGNNYTQTMRDGSKVVNGTPSIRLDGLAEDTYKVNGELASLVKGNAQTGYDLTRFNGTILDPSSFGTMDLSDLDPTRQGKIDGIAPYATVGANWSIDVSARPVELTDGRVSAGLLASGELARDLKPSTLIDQGNGVGRAAVIGLETGVIRDGDAVTFAEPYSTIPSVIFLPSGLTTSTALVNPAAISYSAENLTVTGFTAGLKLRELAGTPISNTDTASATSPYDFAIDKSDTTPDAAVDNNYEFDISVYLGSNGWAPQILYADLLAKKTSGGSWMKYGTITAIGVGNKLNLKQTINVTGIVDFTGAQFAVDLNPASSAGVSITAFNAVRYETGTPGSEVDSVPVGASSVPYMVIR